MSAGAVAEISTARAWLLAARPATLPAAAVPVFVGVAAAMSEGANFRPLVFLVTLLSAVFIQVGTNFANDYSDFHRGADNDQRLGPVRVTQSGLIAASDVKRGIIVAFGIATALGAILVWIGGWPILAIGVAAVIAGLAYTGGPFPFGYHGLGDAFVFVFFGLVAVTGTAYLQLGTWSVFSLLVSVPVGLIVTNILVVNNLRDISTDREAGKRTLAVRIGERATRAQYSLFTASAYVIIAAVAFSGDSRRALFLPLITAPYAVSIVRKVSGGASGRDLNPELERTGRLLLFFGVLLAIGMLASTP